MDDLPKTKNDLPPTVAQRVVTALYTIKLQRPAVLLALHELKNGPEAVA